MARAQRKAASGVGREIAPGVFWLEVGGGLDRSNVYRMLEATLAAD